MEGESRRLEFHFLRPLILSEYHFKRIIILGQLLELDEEPVWEMTTNHPPQREEKTRETLIFLRFLSLMTKHLKEVYFTF